MIDLQIVLSVAKRHVSDTSDCLPKKVVPMQRMS